MADQNTSFKPILEYESVYNGQCKTVNPNYIITVASKQWSASCKTQADTSCRLYATHSESLKRKRAVKRLKTVQNRSRITQRLV